MKRDTQPLQKQSPENASTQDSHSPSPITRRRFLHASASSLGLALVGGALGSILSGCAVSSSSPAPTTAPSGGAPAPTGAAAAAAPTQVPSGKKVTLSVANYQWTEVGFREFYEESTDAFAKEKGNVEIEKVAMAKGQFGEKMLVAVKAGNPPDLIMFDSIFPQLMAAGELEPMDSWMDKTDIKQKWNPLQKSYPVTDGKTYGMMIMAATYNEVFYNKRLFADVGLSAPPKTLDEFYDYAVKLTKGDQFGLGTSTKQAPEGAMYQDVSEFLFAYGKHWGENGKVNFQAPEVINAVKFYSKLINANVSPRNMDLAQYRQMFAEGKIGMSISGPWQLVPVLQNPAMKNDLGIALMPSVAPKRMSVASTNTLYIPKQAKNKDLAAEYLVFIAQPKWQKRFYELTLTAPGMMDAVPDGLFKQYPWLETFSESTKYATALNPSGLGVYRPQLEKVVAKYVSSTFGGNMKVEDAMAAAQAEMEGVLKDKPAA